MDERLKQLEQRYAELETQLQSADVAHNPDRLKTLSKEYSDISGIITNIKKLRAVEERLADTRSMIHAGEDSELQQLAQEDLVTLEQERLVVLETLKRVLRPTDPMDGKNILMEIRAGAGGDEAALFASELYRMYTHFAESHGFVAHLVDANRTGIGGYKEVIVEIKGGAVYRLFKYESGVHRVQRVPETEKSGRVHTSTATVVVLPEPEAVDFDMKMEDLKIEATTSSGHGGQSVNTTYSAIRMTHIPTGITVSCQDERSQKQNKEKAMQIMRARVFAFEHEKQQRAASEARKSQIGTGDRSEKIRTYNIPQDRVTDHRIKENFPSIHAVLDGALDPIVEALERASDETQA